MSCAIYSSLRGGGGGVSYACKGRKQQKIKRGFQNLCYGQMLFLDGTKMGVCVCKIGLV